MSERTLPKVYVVSPLSAPTLSEIEANMKRAEQLCLYAMLLGDVAAFAPHAFYPRFLDDGSVPERELGMAAGVAWMDVADAVWVFTKRGYSKGMVMEIERAARDGKPILFDPSCWAGVGDE